MSLICFSLIALLGVIPALSVKPFPEATRPPVPPPPPPAILFVNFVEPAQLDEIKAQVETEMIAPNIHHGTNPSLSIGNPQFNVGGTHHTTNFRPALVTNFGGRPTVTALNPQIPYPFQQGYRPQPQRPQHQRPQPQRPFSRPISRPQVTVPQRPAYQGTFHRPFQSPAPQQFAPPPPSPHLVYGQPQV